MVYSKTKPFWSFEGKNGSLPRIEDLESVVYHCLLGGRAGVLHEDGIGSLHHPVCQSGSRVHKVLKDIYSERLVTTVWLEPDIVLDCDKPWEICILQSDPTIKTVQQFLNETKIEFDIWLPPYKLYTFS